MTEQPSRRTTTFAAKIALLILIMAAGAIPWVINARFHIHYFDEPYFITNGLNYQATPLAPLTGWITGLVGDLIDWEWLKFRYIHIALYFTATLIGVIYMLKRVENFATVATVAATCVLVPGLRTYMNYYGWDSYSALEIALLTVVTLSYLTHRSSLKIVILGLLTAIAGLTRIPNFAAAAFIATAIVIIDYNKDTTPIKQRLLAALAYITLTLAFSTGAIIVLYGSVANYISAFSENPTGQHNLLAVLYGYIVGATLTAPHIAMFCCGYHVLNLCERKHRSSYFITAIVAALAYYVYITTNYYSSMAISMIIPAAMAVPLIAMVAYRDRRCRLNGKSGLALTLLALSCVPFIGSNCHILRFGVWPAIPIAIGLLEGKRIKGIMLVALAFGIGYVAPHLYQTFSNSINSNDTRLNCGVMRGMNSKGYSRQGKQFIESMYADFSSYNDKPGTEAIVLHDGCYYVWDYLFLKRNDYIGNRFPDPGFLNDPGYVEWAAEKIASAKRPIAVLLVTAEGYDPKNVHEPTEMEKMLDGCLHKVVSKEGHLIYVSEKGMS